MKVKTAMAAALIVSSFFVVLLLVGALRAQDQKVEEKPTGIVNHSAGNHLRNLREPALVLKGAKVSTEAQAKELAWKHYITLMLKARGISATEGPRVVAIESLGFDMPGFAKKGDAVWEVRVIDFVSGLNAIAWVHPETKAIKFLLLPIPAT